MIGPLVPNTLSEVAMKKTIWLALFLLGCVPDSPTPNANNVNNVNNANNVNNVNNVNNINNVNNLNNVTAEICNDTIDNDGDGATDCDDSDCANTANCAVNNVNNINNTNNNNQLKIYQSGTRIKMKVGITADGSKEFKNFYDSQLNIDCSFTQDVNGTFRCLPRNYSSLAYSNSSCTVPIALSTCPFASGAYFIAYDMSVTCLNFGQYGARGYLVSTSFSGQFYLKSNGNCAGPYDNTSGYNMYNAQEIALSQFVEQAISIE
jgi:hypothetical protein